MMKKIMYIISILLSIYIIAYSLVIIAEGAFSWTLWETYLWTHIIDLDYVWEGFLLIGYSICFIFNMKWIHQKKYLSMPILILLIVNLMFLGYIDHYLSEFIWIVLLLIVIYIMNVYIVNSRQKNMQR